MRASCVLVLLAAAGIVMAAEEDLDDDFFDRLTKFELGGVSFKVGGQVRLRGEHVSDFDFDGHANDNEGFWLLRSRLSLDAAWSEQLRTFVQLQDSRNYDHPASPRPFVDRVDLQQAYVDLTWGDDPAHRLRLGRQDIRYGDGRLVSNSGWHNFGIFTFDAARLSLDLGDVNVDLLAASPVEFRDNHFNDGTHHVYFYALYASYQGVEDHTLDAYFMVKDDTRDIVASEEDATDIDDVKTYTVGVRGKGKLSEEVDYNVEGAYQFGDWGPDDHRAWAAHLSGGYTFDAACSPRLGLHCNYATGDSTPTDGDHESFDILFPSNAFRYGWMNLMSWRNLLEVGTSVTVKPTKKLKLLAKLGVFWLDEEKDAWYTVGGGMRRRDLTGKADERLGKELDLVATYTANEHLSFLAGCSWFFTDRYIDDTGPDSDANWFFFESRLNF